MPIMIDDVINSIEVELEAAVRTRDKAVAEVKYILKAASDNGQTNLSRADTERVDDLFAQRDKAKVAITGIQAKLDSAKRAKAEELETAELQRESRETGVPRPAHDRQTASLQVGRNERTYRPDTDRKGARFLRDVARAYLLRDAEAQHRLDQHMHEERIERAGMVERAAGDATTSSFVGLVVPQYLTDMYAPAVAALRPFADICNHHDLPESGMTVNIALITTPSQVALTATELPAGNVAAQSLNDTLLTENVQTAAGQQTLSRQAIDRGTGIEEVSIQDLFKRYATTLDSTLINQAITGVSALCNPTQIAYTTASPTVAGLYPKILGATANVEATLLAQALPTHTIMHSRRWYWMASQLTATWPLINTMGAALPWSGGTMDPTSGYDKGVRGVLPSGLQVVVDNNVPVNLGAGVNQDEIYVVARDECHLWEDPNAPVYIRAEQPKAAQLGVLLVLYGYFAFTLRRYGGAAIGSIGGTGLVPPTF